MKNLRRVIILIVSFCLIALSFWFGSAYRDFFGSLSIIDAPKILLNSTNFSGKVGQVASSTILVSLQNGDELSTIISPDTKIISRVLKNQDIYNMEYRYYENNISSTTPPSIFIDTGANENIIKVGDEVYVESSDNIFQNEEVYAKSIFVIKSK